MKRLATAALAISALVVLTPLLARAQLFSLTKDQMIAWTTDNPFDRFPDGRPKVPDGLIERARGLSSEEVFAILPGKGFRNQYEDGFQVLHPDKKLVGRAFTVQFMPMRPDLDDGHQRQGEGGRPRSHVQPGRDRHAAAGRRPGG